MPTTNSWNPNADGDFDTAANWSLGTVPDSNNDATINTASIHTITHNSGNDIVNSLTVGNDFFVMNGGSLMFLAGASFAQTYTQNGGAISGAGTVSISGAGSLLGGAATGSLALQIGGTIALSNYTLAGSATLVNAATTNQTGQITIGDNSGVNAKITNTAAGTYTINGDYGIGQGAATASFVNAGALQKTAGTGTSLINVSVSDTGTISVASGTLQFDGPTDSYSGAISGAGQFAVGGAGSHTLAAGTTITTNAFGVYDSGTVLTLGGNLSYGGTFSEGFGSTINLNGKTLTLSGAANLFNSNFGTPTINGSGVFATSGTTTLNDFVLGGSVNWSNTGTVNLILQSNIGDSGSAAATFTNASGGHFNFAGDVNLERGAAATSKFINQTGATLAKTAGNGTSFVDVGVTDTGAISVATGTLEFRGANNSFSGAISGAGQFALGGGSVDTLAAGTSITTSSFAITDSGTSVTLGANLAYAGAFSMGFGSAINLNGHVLTLSGVKSFFNSNFGTPTINGSGTLATSNATTLADFTLGGTVIWNTTGVITQTLTNQLGDGSGGAVTLNNAGHFNIASDTNLERGSSALSKVNNTGTIEKTAGNGTSFVDINVVDTGSVVVDTGVVEFRGPNSSFGGKVTGAGQFALAGGSTDTLKAFTAFTVSTFGIYDGGTSVTLAANLSYAKTFIQNNSSTINLAGFTLSLSGAASFFNTNFGTPVVGGSGVLATSGATSVNIFTLGGTVNWTNSGTVSENGTLQIGDGSPSVATFTNQAAGHYNLTNDSGITIGSAGASSFSNAGAFAKTGGNGKSIVNANFVNSGTVEVQSGALEFANSVSGAGAMTIDAGTTLELGGAVAGGTFHFAAATGTLQIDNISAFNGAVTGFAAGDAINVGGTIRSLSYSGSTVTVTLTNNQTGTFALTGSVTGLQAVGSQIVAASSPYTLTTGTDIVAFAAGTNSVNGVSTTLNAGDSLTGGSGTDTLNLSGGGAFHLESLAAFNFDNVTLAPAANYNITASDVDVASGRTLVVSAQALTGGSALTFDGSASTAGAFQLFGGTGDDFFRTGAGNDIFVSGTGVDTMIGGAGNDTYRVQNSADIVTEAVGGGNDIVLTSVSYSLQAGSEIESLVTNNAALTTAINLTGNGFTQTITGNAGANVIDGGGGNDTITGGAGADTFVFDTTLNGATNDPTIVDFTVGTDHINLAQSIFSALPTGALPAGMFVVGAAATNATQHILYNSGSGALLYDADGNGSGAAVQFATLSKSLALTAASFQVV